MAKTNKPDEPSVECCKGPGDGEPKFKIIPIHEMNGNLTVLDTGGPYQLNDTVHEVRGDWMKVSYFIGGTSNTTITGWIHLPNPERFYWFN